MGKNCLEQTVCREQFESPNFGLKQAHFLAITMTQLPADIQYAQIKGQSSFH